MTRKSVSTTKNRDDEIQFPVLHIHKSNCINGNSSQSSYWTLFFQRDANKGAVGTGVFRIKSNLKIGQIISR